MEMGEKKPFRLLDLAAELRSQVFELALTHDRPNGQKAAPALLRTCRQVYSEAKPLLYEQSNLLINISLELVQDKRSSSYSRLCRFGGDLKGTITGDSATRALRRTWPPHVAKVKSLTVYNSFAQVAGFSRISSANYAIINRVMYSLACCLKGSANKGRKVYINLRDTPGDKAIFNTEQATLEQIFYPIAKLPRSINLQIGEYLKDLEPFISALRTSTDEEKILRFNAVQSLTNTFIPYETELERVRIGRQSVAKEHCITTSVEAYNEAKEIMEDKFLSFENDMILQACFELMDQALTEKKGIDEMEEQERRTRRKAMKAMVAERADCEQHSEPEESIDPDDDYYVYTEEDRRASYSRYDVKR